MICHFLFYFSSIGTCQFLFRKGIFASYRALCCVIVVGNPSVETVKPLSLFGWSNRYNKRSQVGVISRGYEQSSVYPLLVTRWHGSIQGGRWTRPYCTTYTSPCLYFANRRMPLNCYYSINLVVIWFISDDGLQHYRLQRDFEIVELDVQRGFRNGFYYLYRYVSYQAV